MQCSPLHESQFDKSTARVQQSAGKQPGGKQFSTLLVRVCVCVCLHISVLVFMCVVCVA